MRFESEWPGDAIAAPIFRTYDREDVLLRQSGGQTVEPARQPLGRGPTADVPRLQRPIWRVGAHRSSQSLRSLPGCGGEYFANARFATSERAGR
jgi:hypothetical protein